LPEPGSAHDQEWIAYVDNNHSLVVMRPDGTDRRALSIDPGRDEIIGPSWGVAPFGLGPDPRPSEDRRLSR